MDYTVSKAHTVLTKAGKAHKEGICDLAQHTVLEGGNGVQARTPELAELAEVRCDSFL